MSGKPDNVTSITTPPLRAKGKQPALWVCAPPCSSDTFLLSRTGKVYCAVCMYRHDLITFTVHESPPE